MSKKSPRKEAERGGGFAPPNPSNPENPEQLVAADRPQGIPDPQKKSSGHGKKTADKWNQ